MIDALAAVALVVVPLAQVPLVAWLARYVELDADEPRPSPGRGYVTYGVASARPGAQSHDSRSRCPHCGSAVDGDYDYCGTCAGRLPPRLVGR